MVKSSKTEAERKLVAARKLGVLKSRSASNVKQFDAASKKFAKKATTSKARALKTLISMGISTPSGKVTKRYQ